ncbi:hypothetical protein PUN28_009287 [Cardiocondyla obscurior]
MTTTVVSLSNKKKKKITIIYESSFQKQNDKEIKLQLCLSFKVLITIQCEISKGTEEKGITDRHEMVYDEKRKKIRYRASGEDSAKELSGVYFL